MFQNSNIFLVPTYKCNAFCFKCMTRHHVHLGREMPLEILDKFILQLKKHNFSGCVSLGTGEPLGYPHLEHLLTELLGINDKITVRLLTNGMLLTDDLPDVVWEDRVKIGVTRDAMNQDSFSGVQRGVDVADVKLNLVKSAKLRGLSDHFYLNFTLYRHTVDEIPGFCEFAVACGIKEIYITPVKVFDGFQADLVGKTVEKTPELVETIQNAKRFLQDKGIDPSGIDIFKKHHRFGCYLKGTAGPIVDVDGSVCFCSGQEDVYVGNISDADIADKWRNFAQSIDTKEWCSKCRNIPDADGIYPIPSTIHK